MASKDKCIINVALHHWYPKGQVRLQESLKKVGFDGTFRKWTNDWPNGNYDGSCAYNCKAAAFEEAIKEGYRKILWLDCSVWALLNPDPIFDLIEKDGYYFIHNGYNLAQTVSDRCLGMMNITRNEAEKMKECASGIFGVNMDSDDGSIFISEFIKACKKGACHGSRHHDNQSQDPRFLFHRQDQSVASVLLNIMGLKMHEWGDHVMYEPKDAKKNTILTLRGM